ncbi:MAG: hypothetical protein ACR2J8_04445, partial [Thermomicrobiales bacterium]
MNASKDTPTGPDHDPERADAPVLEVEIVDDVIAEIVDVDATAGVVAAVTSTARPSALDRAFEFRETSWLAICWLIAIGAAIALRLGDLDRWALSAKEGAAAFDAWRMYTGNPGAPGDLLPASNPLPMLLESLSYFLFGVTDATFRMPSAIFGLAVLPLAWLLTPAVGRTAACAMALLAAVSPILVQSARTGDGQTIAAVLLLGALVAVVRIGQEEVTPGAAARGAALIGLAAAGAIACGGSGVLALVILLGALAVGGSRDGIVKRGLARFAERRNAIAALAALAAALIVLFSRIFTAPAALIGIPQALGEALALLTQPGPTTLGIMGLLMLLLYEPVSALLAGYGLRNATFPDNDRSVMKTLAAWLGIGVIVWGLAIGAGPEQVVHLALPLVLLGGIGLNRLAEAIDWRDVRAGRGAILLLAVLAASGAAFAVVVLLGRNPGAGDRLAVVGPGIGVAMLALVPLLYLITRIAGTEREDGLTDQPARLALAALAIMLGAFGLSTATHLIFERAGTGKEPIAQFVSTGSVRPTVDRLGRLARDAGVTDGSVRDVEGGHSLTVAIDERVAQPWRWYLRDFPFAEPAAAGTTGAANAQVLISPPEDLMPDGYTEQLIPMTTNVPAVYQQPDLPDLLKWIVLPERWLAGARFLHFREGVDVPPAALIRLATNRSLTVQTETSPTEGPYSLDDRPGPGAGDGQFMQPIGIATGVDGTIYVMDSGNARVERFTPDGAFIGAWGPINGIKLLRTDEGFGPTGIATGPDGALYLADTWNHRVLIVDPSGAVIRQI